MSQCILPPGYLFSSIYHHTGVHSRIEPISDKQTKTNQHAAAPVSLGPYDTVPPVTGARRDSISVFSAVQMQRLFSRLILNSVTDELKVHSGIFFG